MTGITNAASALCGYLMLFTALVLGGMAGFIAAAVLLLLVGALICVEAAQAYWRHLMRSCDELSDWGRP